MQRLDEDHEFDHFYLDMNGIIHQCTHPNDDEIAIEDEDEMFQRIFNYTERLYRIVMPRKLMFFAVDGVAPRAKMNQQRSRRFRSAKEAERAMGEAIARGDEIPTGTPFDSNCITPGTAFMYNLSQRFRHWIDKKMKTDATWQQGCTVVFSGSEVPGEGEHKIMDYIRSWKASKDYSPTIRHCMYGLDADLMMLGLVAHSPHFTLIREKLKFGKGGRRVPKMKGTDSDADEFQLLEIAMLRDMLFLEFKRSPADDVLSRPNGRQPKLSRKFEQRAIIEAIASRKTNDESDDEGNSAKKQTLDKFRYDSKRIVDDFVFMCMLVGNDFIPNLPHLDISEGAINIMFRIYKDMLPTWGGYLTDRHRLHPDRLETFLARISHSEKPYFERRAHTDGIEQYRTSEYRRQYYKEKFNFDIDSDEGPEKLQQLKKIYIEGLHWVLQYYHNGVSSWNWFYADFYAPLASDMKGLRSIRISFEKGHPFKPLTQLMAVLPPESAKLLPRPMSDLMTDPNSPVVDFYPDSFDSDINGKKNAWEAVVIVPFIEEDRLLAEVNAIDKEKELTKDEKLRDKQGLELWFKSSEYPRAEEKAYPVRPSKYKIPPRSRSRSRSPSRGNGRTSRGPSPRDRRTIPRRSNPSNSQGNAGNGQDTKPRRESSSPGRGERTNSAWRERSDYDNGDRGREP